MARIKERPRWKRMLYLEFMAIDIKRHIIVEGYMVLLIGLTSPLWCLPVGCWLSKKWLQRRVEMSRRAPYGGINIAESNTARPRWSGFSRRRALSRVVCSRETKAHADLDESPLFRLPEEIRRQIFLYLVRPAPELTICALTKRKRLVALPTSLWLADASAGGQQWRDLLKCLNDGGKPVGDLRSCNDMLVLAKTSRRMYCEVIPLLYGENIFHFHPLLNVLYPGSIEHFLAFTNSIPQARLDSIRHVRLDIGLEFHISKRHRTYLLRLDCEYRWRRTCDTLKRMDNLSTLHIHLRRVAYQTGSRHRSRRRSVDGQSPENRLLKRLIGVRAKKECVVEVPWTKRVVGDLPGAAFQLGEKEGALDDVVDQSLPKRP